MSCENVPYLLAQSHLVNDSFVEDAWLNTFNTTLNFMFQSTKENVTLFMSTNTVQHFLEGDHYFVRQQVILFHLLM
jgi:hypothetical protein